MNISTPGRDQLTVRTFSLAESFKRALLAQNKAPRTVKSYMEAVRGFCLFLQEKGMPLSLPHIRREHVEAFVVETLTRTHRVTGKPLKPATASNRYKSLQQFFKWAVEEGEIKRSPMERMKPPAVPERVAPVLSDEDLKRLLKTVEGKDFYARRDKAILLLLLDTGMRRSEIGKLRVQSVDFEQGLVEVLGKGRRPRYCPFGRKAGQALDRYLRASAGYQRGGARETDALWIGFDGPMGPWGIASVVEERGKQAGLEGMHVTGRHITAAQALYVGKYSKISGHRQARGVACSGYER